MSLTKLETQLAQGLRKYYEAHSLTLANWPTIIITALQQLDVLLEDKEKKRTSLSFPDGFEQKRDGSVFASSLSRLHYNEEKSYIVTLLHAIQAVIVEPSPLSNDLANFLNHFFTTSGRALIEVIGEVHYHKIHQSSERRNSKRVFQQIEAEKLYSYLLIDIEEITVTIETWPLLVAAAKHYADTHYGVLEMNSRKQIIVEALANLIDHLCTDELFKTNKSFILESITPILDLLMGEEPEPPRKCPCPCWFL
jgi:hypothetical protein